MLSQGEVGGEGLRGVATRIIKLETNKTNGAYSRARPAMLVTSRVIQMEMTCSAFE